MTPDLAALLAALQLALGTNVACGQITLNVSEGAIQSFETKTFRRVTAKTMSGNVTTGNGNVGVIAR